MTSYREHFVAALDAYRSVPETGEFESKRYWDELELAAAGGEAALEVARRFIQSNEAERFHVSIDFIGVLAREHVEYRDLSVDIVLDAIAEVDDALLLCSAANTLGSTRSPRAIPFLLGCLDGNDDGLRMSAVNALATCVDQSLAGRKALMHATTDFDVELRRLATFGLAMKCAVHDEMVCDALAARLFDPDDEVRNEAIRGLAVRKDQRAVEPVRRALESDDIAPQILDAAEYLGIRSE